MSEKKRIRLKILKNQSFGFSLCLILVSSIFMFVAFFSYGKLNASKLKTIETTIFNVQEHSNYRKAWVTFSSSDGHKFYCRTDGLISDNVESFAKVLREEYGDKILSVSYTERRDLLPFNLIDFWGYERLVVLECNGEKIVGLDDYNRLNFGFCIGFAIIALIGYLLEIFLLILLERDTLRKRYLCCAKKVKQAIAGRSPD